ncbi:MAG TPA: lipoyl(octanoyl) transferase LipB [Phycisphaerales bacterium]|nr:lipoyl(octanoyl) transferase LipB [Phycisphaerales bacterium]
MLRTGIASAVPDALLSVHDLGRLAYGPALDAQRAHHGEVLAARERGEPVIGRILTVEHPPVITMTPRPGVAEHLLASPEFLAERGVEVCETDRGGDITYHGPGQLVVYPIIDLKTAGLRVVEYIRLLERAVIDAIAPMGLVGVRDPEATGVWVSPAGGGPEAKVCAIGVRVRKWITMHGLALNVRPDLDHFGLIVPCGLSGRPVTSLLRELGDHCPTMDGARSAVVDALRRLLMDSAAAHGKEV